MNFNKGPATQCPKCGYDANTTTALSCTVCAHPLRETLAPVKARQAFVGKGALSSKSLLLSRNPPTRTTRKSTSIEKNPALLRWIALALPPLLIGAGYLIGSNSGHSKLSNSIPAPSSMSEPFVNQSPQITQTQTIEVPVKEPLEKPPTSVGTQAPKPSKKWVIPLQKETPQKIPPLPSTVKPRVKVKSEVKPKELTAERPRSQASQTVESKPIADAPSVVVIDSSDANAGNPSRASVDCYGGQTKQNYPCRNRKN